MGPGYFIIAIMGCADGSAACTPLATVPTHYASRESCSAARGEALVANSDLDAPNLVAECRSVTAPLRKTVGVLQQVAAGDLTVSLDVDTTD